MGNPRPWRRGVPNKKRDPLERLLEKTDRSGGPDACWTWQGRSTTTGGYGLFSIGYRAGVVHRFAYELLVGPIPPGLDLDHMCHNEDRDCPGGVTCPHRLCVNPSHLEPSTRGDNLRRSGRLGGPRKDGFADWQKAKTHCPAGHPYDDENTYINPSRPNARYCRECHRVQTRERRARLR